MQAAAAAACATAAQRGGVCGRRPTDVKLTDGEQNEQGSLGRAWEGILRGINVWNRMFVRMMNQNGSGQAGLRAFRPEKRTAVLQHDPREETQERGTPYLYNIDT